MFFFGMHLNLFPHISLYLAIPSFKLNVFPSEYTNQNKFVSIMIQWPSKG